MWIQRAVPPGPAATPESLYTGLRLGDLAGSDRPHVVANLVGSADGKATAAGRTAGLGGEADRAAFHLLRTQVDAVVAGTGTLRAERYGALVREERMAQIRVAEGRPAQPLTVVISRSGDIPFEIPLFAARGSRIALYAPPGTVSPECAATVIEHEIPADGDHLAAVLGSLRQEHGVRSLLCEGGPVLFNAMLAQGLIDELFLTLAPTLVGGGELPLTIGLSLPQPVKLRLLWALEREGLLLLRYARS